MLWELEIQQVAGEPDREGERIRQGAVDLDLATVTSVRSSRSYLIEGDLEQAAVSGPAARLLANQVVESCNVRSLPSAETPDTVQLNVLYKPGVTDNVAQTALRALRDIGLSVENVATCRKYSVNADASSDDVDRLGRRLLANDAIEQIVQGPLAIESLALGRPYEFELVTTPMRELDDAALERLSREGQLYLSLTEMQTIQAHFRELGREPTDVELETIAQTWSEHCSHKTLAGRIRYRDDSGERTFENMLKETVFAATQQIRAQLGKDDWCVSVFRDNAGVVTFDERQDVCFKVETHNHPSALEPYGGANTGLGGVIRDSLGTGLGGRPVCNTDVFCFAPPDMAYDELPPGILHPKSVMQGVVSGVRDYGNRMGIPTVNGAVYFDRRYLGNPLVYCGNVAMIPVGMSEKKVVPGDLIVSIGGRTGRDGIHGATFSSAELTHESESVSGGAVQIGNAVVEKMVADVVLEARDRKLFHAITDCGAGGFSSAVGEMGEECGAEVSLETAPLKYAGLSYTEIWISEAQERMVLAVPAEHWDEFQELCAAEGVEATSIGRFTDTGRLVLKYDGTEVGNLSMEFLHGGRPPVVRDAVYQATAETAVLTPSPRLTPLDSLKAILASLNVCSKEWIIRQYDHEVQAGSVVKPLVGPQRDGPSDAAVVRPDLQSSRGLVIACGMNPRYGDGDPYWMAAAAIDEAIRNCVSVGADPAKIAILDNFCWGNTERAETLGSLVRAALGCHDAAIALGVPFISGKDSLNNEFSYVDECGTTRTISIPPSLLISSLGQIDDVESAVTMDLKQAGNTLLLVGATQNELGGSHYALVNELTGGQVPKVDLERAPGVFAAVHRAIRSGLVRSCHDLSEGGLAAALAEMAFAGALGAEVCLDELARTAGIDDPLVLLFSESNTRFLIETDRPDELIAALGLDCVTRLGTVTAESRLSIGGLSGLEDFDASLDDLKHAWKEPLAWG